MLLKPLTVVAGVLALPASRAFLIPPEVSDHEFQVANTIESIGPHVAESHLVDLECPGCPIRVRTRHGKDIQLKTDRTTYLQLNFSIDHQPDHDRLLVNGAELYPSGLPVRDVIWAPQTIDYKHPETRRQRDHDHEDDENGHGRKYRKRPHRLIPQPQRLGFVLFVGKPQSDAERQFELVDVQLDIVQLDPTFVSGIPSLKVRLIKDASGRLLMSQVEKLEPKQPSFLEPTDGQEEECATLMCRMRAIVREKLRKLKGHCHGGKGPAHVAGEPAHPHPHPHPHHHHPPHGPGHWTAPYREHRWGKLFKHIGSHIVFPVIIGIVAGVAVSIIGMAIGTSIVSVWRFFRRGYRGQRGRRCGHRRHHSGHAHHKAAQKEAALAEEKSGLMEHQDPPPTYEEAEAPKTEEA